MVLLKAIITHQQLTCVQRLPYLCYSYEPTLFCRRNCWSALAARDSLLSFKLTTYHCRFNGNPCTSSMARSPLATSSATDSRESTAIPSPAATPSLIASILPNSRLVFKGILAPAKCCSVPSRVPDPCSRSRNVSCCRSWSESADRPTSW